MNQNAIIDSPLVEHVWEVTIDWIEPLLGSQPSSDIARRFVEDRQRERLTRELLAGGMTISAARAAAEERLRQTTVALDGAEDEDEEDLHITVFPRDDEGLHLWDYQIKGFLKGATKLLGARVPGKRAGGSASAITDLQLRLWVFGDARGGRRIPLLRDGARILEADTELTRTIRVDTPRGQRTSIAVSEALSPPVSATFLLAGIRGGRITTPLIEELLAVGQFEGMGQWRSSGLGRFIAAVREVR